MSGCRDRPASSDCDSACESSTPDFRLDSLARTTDFLSESFLFLTPQEERPLLMGTWLVSPGIPDFPLASDASTIDFLSTLRYRTSSATATGLPVPQRLRVHRLESRV
ncbi:hypothetical protein NN561_020249 [Cricetulus griseus]